MIFYISELIIKRVDCVKGLLYVLKNIIVCLCTGIVLGFFVMLGVWALSSTKPDSAACLRVLKVGSAAGAVLVAAVKLVYTIFDRHPVSKAVKLAELSDTPEKGTDMLLSKIHRTSDPTRKNAYMLILSALYTENEQLDKALEILDKIDFRELSSGLEQEYFNAYLYVYLIMGDLKNAEKVCTDASPYFEKPGASLLHTLGVFEYAKGNYGKARSYLLRSRSADSSDRNVCDCDLYMALCSLKEGKADDAKALANDAEMTLSTRYQERDLGKLKELIEKYEHPTMDTSEIIQDEPQEQTPPPEETQQEERTTTDD